jgi:hypothetical protein
MGSRWAALAIVLALGVLVPRQARAQGAGPPPAPGKHGTGLILGQNYPNPFGPETRIPFTVGDSACAEPTRTYKVSLKIYNLLAQLVAVPILQNGTISLSGGGQPLQEMQLTCGTYTAYWNGSSIADKRTAPSGLYLYQLDVDGKTDTKKMILLK